MPRPKAARPAQPSKTQVIQRTAALLKQAADPTRLLILRLLDGGERNVGALCEEVGGMSQPALSQHLALLRHSRLVEPRRDGKRNFYRLTDQGRALSRAVAGVSGRR